MGLVLAGAVRAGPTLGSLALDEAQARILPTSTERGAWLGHLAGPYVPEREIARWPDVLLHCARLRADRAQPSVLAGPASPPGRD